MMSGFGLAHLSRSVLFPSCTAFRAHSVPFYTSSSELTPLVFASLGYGRKENMGSTNESRQGDENLDLMSHAPRYTKYIGQLVRRHLPESGLLMDIGSGNGQQTLAVHPPSERIVCIESSNRQQESLRSLGYRVFSSISESGEECLAGIFSLNCFEHIKDDVSVLSEATARLVRGGRVVIFVPAMPILFSEMDRHVGHMRRYSRKSLRSLLESSEIQLESLRYVDSCGALISLIYKVLPGRDGEPSSWSLRVFDTLILPLSRAVDLVTHRFWGKNLIAIGVKR